MNDSGLRELEQRFQATRSPADEAIYLRAAREVGVLTEEQLRLAAYAHHPSALELVGPQYRVKPKLSEELEFDKLSGRWLESETATPVPPSPGEILIGWANGLGTWGLEAELRAGLAYAYLILRSLERHLDRPSGDLIAFPWKLETLESLVRVNGARVDAVAAWVQNPAPVTRRRVDAALNLPDAKMGFLSVDDEQGSPVDLYGWCDQLGRVGEELAFAVGAGRVAFERWWSAACTTDEAVLHRVQSVFGKALIPWALGYGDPLRARQSTRLARTRPALICGQSGGGEGRHTRCACGQVVYDISELTPAEAEQLIRSQPGGRLAVRLYRRPDGRLQVNDCDPALEALAYRTTELDSASSIAA